jgi:hypothetical protein
MNGCGYPSYVFRSKYPAVEETHVFVLVVSVLLVSSLHFLTDFAVEGLQLHCWQSLLASYSLAVNEYMETRAPRNSQSSTCASLKLIRPEPRHL